MLFQTNLVISIRTQSLKKHYSCPIRFFLVKIRCILCTFFDKPFKLSCYKRVDLWELIIFLINKCNIVWHNIKGLLMGTYDIHIRWIWYKVDKDRSTNILWEQKIPKWTKFFLVKKHILLMLLILMWSNENSISKL